MMEEFRKTYDGSMDDKCSENFMPDGWEPQTKKKSGKKLGEVDSDK